jgi:hypothetical protein
MTRTPQRETDAVEQLIAYIDDLTRNGIIRDHRELEEFAGTLDPDSFSGSSAAWRIYKKGMRSFVDQLGSSREKATAGLQRLARRRAREATMKARQQARSRSRTEDSDKKVDAWGGICRAVTETYRLFALIDHIKPDDRGRRQQLLEEAFMQSRDGISLFISVCPKRDPFQLAKVIPANLSMGTSIVHAVELRDALSRDRTKCSRFLDLERDFLSRNHVSPEVVPRIRDSMTEALAGNFLSAEELSARWPSALRRLRSRSKPPRPAVTWLRVYSLYKALQGALIFFQPVIPDWEPPQSSNTIHGTWDILLIMIGSEILIRSVDE